MPKKTRSRTTKKRIAKGYLFQGKALSIAQPWASAIAFGGKDVENRSWRTHYRGPLAIHASGTFFQDDVDIRRRRKQGSPRLPVIELIRQGSRPFKLPDDEAEIPTSHIVAIAMLTDCVERSRSPWYVADSWGWVLQGVVPIKPIPMTGGLGIWDCRFRYEPLPPT